MITSKRLFLATTALTLLSSVAAPGFARQAHSTVPEQSAAAPVPPNRPSQSDASATASVGNVDTQNGGDIVVTGSRVGRPGFTAPTPTKVLTAEALETRGLSNVGDFLNEIPSFRGSQTTQTNSFTALGGGQNFADLRGLGSIRTLTLVDGRRFVPSSATGQVDLNLTPTILIDRVDVVTGGASAAYGSDAVSGVVNVILNKRLQGFKSDVSYGLTTYGDNKEGRVSLAFGTKFAGDRGHIVIGGEYVSASGVNSYEDRPWGRRQPALVSYVGPRPADAPSRFYAEGVQALNYAFGGVVIGSNADTNPANGADVLRGIQFGPNGAVQAFPYGTMVGTSSINFTGGDPGLYERNGLPLVLPLERRVAMAHVDYELSDLFHVFLDANYGRSGGESRRPPVRDTNANGIIIQRDNAFLPASVAALMTTNGIAFFPLGRANNDFGEIRADNENTTERIVVGFDGSLGGDWRWDGYYENGKNTFDSTISNLRIEQNFRFATDAVRDGSGNVVCRDAGARAQGCVPINLFGPGSPTAAAIGYITGTQFYKVVTKQQVAALTLRGEPFSTWAGKVAVALGGEYRKEGASAVSDSVARRSGFNYSNPQPFSGSYNVKEGFFEAVVPLARDVTFAKALDFNGAVRVTDYSNTGRVETWKLGLTWEPVSGLRFRAARSLDIRAPNNSELFSQTSARGTLINTFSGVQDQFLIINAASPSLRPERSYTTTVGLAISPQFIPRLNLTVDYYNISVDGAISGVPAQVLIDNCAAEAGAGSPGFYCSFIDRTGTGTSTIITQVRSQLINLASLKSSGVDFDVNTRFPFVGAQWSAGISGNYVAHLISNDGLGIPRSYNTAGLLTNVGSIVDRAGQVGAFNFGLNNGATSSPNWTLISHLTLDRGPLSATVQGRYVGGGVNDKTLVGPGDRDYDPRSPISIGNNRIDGRFYLDLSASYDLFANGNRKVKVYTSVSNLLNKEPPFPAVAYSGFYDKVGRFIKVGFRTSF